MLDPPMGEVDIVIASFGVISKLTSTNIYKLNMVRHLVLDEADALFHETFEDKLQVFLKRVPVCSLIFNIIGSILIRYICLSAIILLLARFCAKRGGYQTTNDRSIHVSLCNNAFKNGRGSGRCHKCKTVLRCSQN